MNILAIINQIDIGNYALPEFQRGYVWNREQVRKMMNSLYNDYPIGGLLVWVTKTDNEITRGDGQLTPGSVNLVLDGQQRITSLYGILRGKPPQFFEGNSAAFTGLHFNLIDETFEFYAPVKMRDNPNWINVTDLMLKGSAYYISEAYKTRKDDDEPGMQGIIDRLAKLERIKNIDLYIQEVVGEDKTIDVVVEIFNNVNSGGTKLSKGDLALARICAQWSDARVEMRKILKRFEDSLYNFHLDWLLRCVTVYLTGKPYFTELENVPIIDFQKGLQETAKLIEKILNHIASRLGLDHDRVLGSRYSMPLMVGYLKQQGGNLESDAEWSKLMYWYIHTFLWGRYAGSTESVLAQDLNILDSGEGIDGLIRQLRQIRGDLTVHPQDFIGWSTGARFYPLLYLLTRVNRARDWGTGIELSNALLGRFSMLEVHHIFPKSMLYKHGYPKSLVNALGNYAFLIKETNLNITNKDPVKYIPEYMTLNPGAVESHWMPTDQSMLMVENYGEFLKKRRELLAKNTNEFLDTLLTGSAKQVEVQDFVNRTVQAESYQEEEEILIDVNRWMSNHGLHEGISNYPLVNDNGEDLMIIDLAWPQGIQEGLSEPVALLINESDDNQEIVNNNGYKYFTDANDFKAYVTANYLVA